MKFTKILYSLIFLLIPLFVFGQGSGKVELQGADSLAGVTINGEKVTKLIGNVIFKQRDGILYADSVYQYREREVLEAFGNVRMTQADTITMTSNRATYNGNSRTAKMIGNVVMRDPRMTLTTPSLDYDLKTRIANYTEGGVLVDPENRLESRRGTYDTNTKLVTFQQNVKVTTKDYNITSEQMKYNTESKVVYFQGPTNIKGQQGDLYAEEGTYNTLEKVSRFGRNAYIVTKEYRLGGDQLYYDQNTGYGTASRNVTLRSLKDNITIRGQEGRYWREQGISKVSGNPVMESIMDNDTLYMAADTLLSRESRDSSMASMIFALKNVKIFKSDLQAKCDSLSFNRTDSVMHMNVKPVLWSEGSQMIADTVHMHLRNKTIERMYMYSNAFIASEDSLQNYNQVKGRDMTAYFQEGKIRRVNVDGNGESLYFALEGDTTLTGMNKAICSNMVLRFDENKLQKIAFLVQPDASFIPPHELPEDGRTLEGFTWLAELRPTKADVKRPVASTTTPETKTVKEAKVIKKEPVNRTSVPAKPKPAQVAPIPAKPKTEEPAVGSRRVPKNLNGGGLNGFKRAPGSHK